MEPAQHFPAGWHAVAWIALGAAVAWACARADWRRLRAGAQSHAFFGAVVGVALLWTIGSGVGPVRFHLLGATLFYLMFGLPLALVGMALAAVAATVATDHGWAAVAERVLLAGVLPVLVSHVVRRAAEARLPANFFVYVFVIGFLGGGLAMLVTVAAVAASLALAAAAATGPQSGAWPALAPLLAFAEATLSGMLITLFVVYKPEWVGTFDDARYLRRRQP
ncbi:MAG: energy-coupling factor ABC transporter permease [Burkholderiales bacterium]